MIYQDTLTGKLIILGIPIAAYMFMIILYSAYSKVKPSPNPSVEIKPSKGKNIAILIIIIICSGLAAQTMNSTYTITNFHVK